MTIKLTDRFLTSRKAPVAGRVIYTDSSLPGLAFRVSCQDGTQPRGTPRLALALPASRAGTESRRTSSAYPAGVTGQTSVTRRRGEAFIAANIAKLPAEATDAASTELAL